jgi:hypothetical protein
MNDYDGLTCHQTDQFAPEFSRIIRIDNDDTIFEWPMEIIVTSGRLECRIRDFLLLHELRKR